MKYFIHPSIATSLALSLVLLSSNCANERPINKLSDNTRSAIHKKDAYQGSFLSKVTVVKTSANSGPLFVGLQSDLRLGYFRFKGSANQTDGTLQFIDGANALMPAGANAQDKEGTLINEWKIEHFDYKLKDEDGVIENEETEDKDKTWQEKRYLQIDFADAEIPESATFPYFLGKDGMKCFDRESAHLADQSFKIENDSIQYEVVVEYSVDPDCNSNLRRWLQSDYTYTVHYLYSFVRETAHSNYRPYIYEMESEKRNIRNKATTAKLKKYKSDLQLSSEILSRSHPTLAAAFNIAKALPTLTELPLERRYGFFQTYAEVKDPRINGMRNVTLMNRWHPEKSHRFYFAPGTPDHYKWIYNDPKIGIIAITNELFKSHGLKIRFSIHENTDGDGKIKKFGDLRYSFVKFVDNESARILGYGPADAHPLTGEIIAANSLIYAEGMRTNVEILRHTVDFNKKPLLDRSLIRSMSDILGDENPSLWARQWNPQQGAGKLFVQALPSATWTHPDASPWTLERFKEKRPLLKTPISSSRIILQDLKPQMDEELYAQLQIAEQTVSEWNEHERMKHSHPRNSTIEEGDHFLFDAHAMLISGMDSEQVIKNLIYQTALHEFGHNLGLRHNFYGSVDEVHFHDPQPLFHEGGKVQLDEEGQPILSQPHSSSVMDYLRLENDSHSAQNWGKYDQAALVYAYSSGYVPSDIAGIEVIDLSKNNPGANPFLYCTDEDLSLNFMCNRHDRGTTPSQVLMDKIMEYETNYQFVNYRFLKQFWNTQGYYYYVLRTMADIKRALAFGLEAMTDQVVGNTLKKYQPHLDGNEILHYQDLIWEENLHTIKLSLAFFAGVHQQSPADRPWRSEYSNQGRDLKRLGVMLDKILATLFLMGDTPMLTNPSHESFFLSYLELSEDAELKSIMERIMKNNLTRPIEMIPGFISFSRVLYAMTATNDINQGNASLINKMRVAKYDVKDFRDFFDIIPDDDTEAQEIILEKAQSTTLFKEFDRVAYVIYNDEIYMVNIDDSPYAADVMRLIREARQINSIGASRVRLKKDIVEMYKLYEKFIK